MFSQHHPGQAALAGEFRPSFLKTLFDHHLSSTSPSTEPQTGTRADWIDQCLRRLRELRPDEDPLFLANMVDEIWHDVPSFHPELAAEMEHECWE